LVKNPIKGGTPAIEKKVAVITETAKVLNFKSLKEYRVLKLKIKD
jgi:hypothetical protein